jgi:hypothetical protein
MQEAITTKEQVISDQHPAAVTAATNSDGVIIPSCTLSMWFNPDNFEATVTDIEKESLPEFFSERYPSKTPTVYKEYRNFMIALYRMNPTVYLSATTVRRHLAGDVNAIIRVHAFLEKWGLINFQCHPRYKPQKMSLLKESSYDKVFINAANQNSLSKNINEYRNNLYLKSDLSEKPVPVKAEENLLKIINICTLSLRPKCFFSECVVGLRWYEHPETMVTVSEDAFRKGHLPPNCNKKEEYVQRTIGTEVWDMLQKSFNEENQIQAEQQGRDSAKLTES